MEGSWAEPGQRDLGLENPGPREICNRHVNLSELPWAIPAPKGHASAAKTKPTISVTVGRHPRFRTSPKCPIRTMTEPKNSMTSMAGFTPAALSALKGRTLQVLQPMAASLAPKGSSRLSV